MKKIGFFIYFALATFVLKAQVYNETNSVTRKALVLYQKDDNGFYNKTENINIPMVDSIMRSYAYDKKSHELYVMTFTGNYVIKVADNYIKNFKNNKYIPQLKGTELASAISYVNALLSERFNKLNQSRQNQIEEKEKQDSIRLVEIKKKKENYRKAHDWRWVPTPKSELSCSLCDKEIFYRDSLFCLGLRNDTLLHVAEEELALGITYMEVHLMRIPYFLKSNERFKYHLEVYGDSLRNDKDYLFDTAESVNYLSLISAFAKVKREAPYGYFNYWDWGNKYGSIEFEFKYTNTNKETIKYIDVYWVVTNDVNDVRKTGHFRGTGPLAEFETAKWNWDYSSYYVSGDASKMQITKVILTYTNGTQKTLTKQMIRYD